VIKKRQIDISFPHPSIHPSICPLTWDSLRLRLQNIPAPKATGARNETHRRSSQGRRSCRWRYLYRSLNQVQFQTNNRNDHSCDRKNTISQTRQTSEYIFFSFRYTLVHIRHIRHIPYFHRHISIFCDIKSLGTRRRR